MTHTNTQVRGNRIKDDLFSSALQTFGKGGFCLMCHLRVKVRDLLSRSTDIWQISQIADKVVV